MTAHVGSVDASGWPYAVPLVYVYEQGDLLVTWDSRWLIGRNKNCGCSDLI
jgi:nitroimidazol reductase NimA-like FMN-containing flavoprotein (pyridoxamine 5'-phosphate oxidase superfamily)